MRSIRREHIPWRKSPAQSEKPSFSALSDHEQASTASISVKITENGSPYIDAGDSIEALKEVASLYKDIIQPVQNLGILYLAVILIVGYLWTELSFEARYKQVRSEGWNAYFNAGKYGFIFFSIAGFIFFILDINNCLRIFFRFFGVTNSSISHWPVELATLKFASIVGIALFVMLISKWFIYETKERDLDSKLTYLKELTKSAHVERLVLESVEQTKQNHRDPVFINITLKSGKVYIGFPHSESTSFESGTITEVLITPYFSGFRDHDTKKLNLINNYLKIFDKSDFKNIQYYSVCIRMDEIESISFFKPSEYKQFNQKLPG